MNLSEEQKKIIDEINNNNNIRCNSCAGSGKTTTIQNIIQHYNNKKFIILTYNTLLRKETIDKIKESNSECHTFHSFGYHYYSKNCINDLALGLIVKNNNTPIKTINFDVLIIDEAQDLDKDLLYNFCLKIIRDNKINDINKNDNDNKTNKNNKLSQICLFGDKRQAINQFRGSDEKIFIYTLFEEVRDLICKNWVNLKLTYSFRITNNLSNFINNNITYKEDINYKINSNKIGSKLRYISTNDASLAITVEIFRYLKLGYNQDDIFIIAPSIKIDGLINTNINISTNFKQQLLNMQQILTLSNLNIEIVNGYDNIKDTKIFKNKILISSIHGTKGLERKVVILLTFDNSYFLFYDKKSDIESCPNTIYTALTRSKEQLSIIKISNATDFKFLKLPDIEKYIDYFEFIFHKFNNINNLYIKYYPNIHIINKVINENDENDETINENDEIINKDNKIINNKNKINIKCDLHGDFNVLKSNFSNGKEFCYKCKIPLNSFKESSSEISLNEWTDEFTNFLQSNLYIEDNIFNNKIININPTNIVRSLNKIDNLTVSRLISFIPFKILESIKINFDKINKCNKCNSNNNNEYNDYDNYIICDECNNSNELTLQKYIINIKSVVKQGDIYENISSTIGNACTLYFEYLITNKINITNKLLLKNNIIINQNKKLIIKLLKVVSKFNLDEIKEQYKIILSSNSISEQENFINLLLNQSNDILIQLILIISEYILMISNSYTHRFLKQIKYYNYLDKDFLLIIKSRLLNFLYNIYNINDNNIFNNLKFEIPCKFRYKNKMISGVIDAIDIRNKIIIEVKFVNNITTEHFIQLLLYKYIIINQLDEIQQKQSAILIDKNTNKPINIKGFKCYLFDLKSNNLYKVYNNLNNIEQYLDKLLQEYE